MSFLTRIVREAMLFGQKSLRTEEAVVRLLSTPRPDAPVGRRTRRAFGVSRLRIASIDVTRLSPVVQQTGPTLLYLHGGAFVSPILPAHWLITGSLMVSGCAEGLVPSYPLLPEGSAATVVPQLLEMYRLLSESGKEVVIAGDSAGAALAVSVAQAVALAGLASPQMLLLYSPWLDLSATNPEMRSIEHRDPVLTREGLAYAGRLWSSPLSPSDPIVSPLFSNLTGLPETHIYQGGHDILAPDAASFVEAATAAGSPAFLHNYPDAFHCFVGARWLPESRHALGHSTRLLTNAAQPWCIRGDTLGNGMYRLGGPRVVHGVRGRADRKRGGSFTGN